MIDLEFVGGISAVAIIMGLVQLSRKFGVTEKYTPLVAIFLGLLASLGYNYFGDQKWFEALIIGLALGLSSIGLESTTRIALQVYREQRK
ncbi:MAG: hypothetical protein Q7J85_03455 [Bacillota bacterium]|nr:hypothetical protein [Bacillota bacterium]